MTNKRQPAVIHPDEAVTLAGLFRQRVAGSGGAVAYRDYDGDARNWQRSSWDDMAGEVGRWQAALQGEGFAPGDRVAIMLRNSPAWVVFDQAALGLGLVTVPLYTNDRPENVAHVLRDAGVRLLLVEGKRQWRQLQALDDGATLERIVSIKPLESEEANPNDRLIALIDWLPDGPAPVQDRSSGPDSLATIVYTSGTSGRPKGVMLSHRNILDNAYAAARCAGFSPQDLFLSFLPLSHALERTAGLYLPMLLGAEVAFARSIQQLSQDLRIIRPTVLVSVPRIFEMIYARILSEVDKQTWPARKLFELTVWIGWRRFEYYQGRAGWHPAVWMWPLGRRLVARKVTAQFGGRLNYAVCGGAALAPPVSRLLIALGVPLYQGYGLTECAPVVSVNRPGDNVPTSIGAAVPGAEVTTNASDELLVRGSSIMLGYWRDEQSTQDKIDARGWLHTGDQARIDDQGHIFITGRLKDILVMATGEKVPPADMEMAICTDGLFDQAMVLGEGKSYLGALVVLNRDQWPALAAELHVNPDEAAALQERSVHKALLRRIGSLLRDFPGYAQVRRVYATLDPWTVEDDLLTPTLKMKRAHIWHRYAEAIDTMFKDHNL